MADATRGPGLTDLDRALRPVRRQLLWLRTAPPGPHAVANLRRLCARFPLDALEAPIAAMLEELDGAVEEADFATAWQLLQRVDAMLGLPLPSVTFAKVKRSLAAEPPKPPAAKPTKKAAQQAVEPAAEVEELVEDEWPALRFDRSILELPLPEATLLELMQAGIETVGQVLLRGPVREEVLSPVHGAGREVPEGPVALGGRVVARTSRLSPDGSVTSEVVLHGADRCVVTWARPFRGWELAALELGARAVVAARREGEALVGGRLAVADHGNVVLLDYGLGDAEDAFVEVVHALLQHLDGIDEVLPNQIVTRAGGVRIADAITRIHTRGAKDEPARRRLAIDELVTAQLARSWRRFQGGADRGIAHQVLHAQVAMLERLDGRPHLDDDEQMALEAIKRDLRRNGPMQRVLYGGASSGMDEVALRAAMMVAESRNQVLVLAPDNPSAMVRHDVWGAALRGIGHLTMLLTKEPRRSELDAMRRGETHVVFAGPDVPLGSLEFRRLGLVVAYEQAVHGVAQERLASRRAPRPDLLTVCRSPLSATVLDGPYATMDLSWLTGDESVAGGQVWAASQREEAYARVGHAVSKGRSGIVAMPLTRTGKDLLDLEAAKGLLGTLAHQVFDGVAVGLYHGEMSASERARVLNDFVERRVRVVVATTAFELVGAMPRGIVGMFDHADRMDLERLLGFRAQVTGAGEMHFVVGTEPHPLGKQAVELLAARRPDAEVVLTLARQRDADLEPVDVHWRWADPAADRELSILARESVHRMLSEDPTLRSGNRPRILRRAHSLWPAMSTVTPPWPPPRGGGGRRRRRRRRRRS